MNKNLSDEYYASAELNNSSSGLQIVNSWNVQDSSALLAARGITKSFEEENQMRKLALALAAAAALGFTAPVFTAMDASAAPGIQLAQADVQVKVRHGHRGQVKKVFVRRDRGWYRGHHRHGWKHRHHGGNKIVVIKKRVYR